ncbi:MAG: hypothetical protein ABIY52_05705 [Gemmatimonadaceae bacterium]
MPSKSLQLQIRVTRAQKESLRRRARAAGLDVSAYVLSRALPPADVRFAAILGSIQKTDGGRAAFAELSDFLSALTPAEFSDAVREASLVRFPPLLQNMVAAMVELAAAQRSVAPPEWTADVEPLATPWFATPMASLRLYLLQASPVAFKRRNLFVDASVGDRV